MLSGNSSPFIWVFFCKWRNPKSEKKDKKMIKTFMMSVQCTILCVVVVAAYFYVNVRCRIISCEVVVSYKYSRRKRMRYGQTDGRINGHVTLKIGSRRWRHLMTGISIIYAYYMRKRVEEERDYTADTVTEQQQQ